MSSESFNPGPPWGLCYFKVSQFCDPTLLRHHLLLAMWFLASYWTSLSLIFILCTHYWKFEALTSPCSIPDPHDTQAEDFREFFFKCCFPTILASGGFIWISCLAESGGAAPAAQGKGNVEGRAKTGPTALCCCKLGIDPRKAGEPWLQSSHITGSREQPVYQSQMAQMGKLREDW